MEYKFRGKSRENDEWIYGSLLGGRLCHIMSHKPVKGHNIVSTFAGNDIVSVKPLSVGMFTGLKDKNGVDVYGGDRATYELGDIILTGTIVFDEKYLIWEFRFQTVDANGKTWDESYDFSETQMDEYQVIPNERKEDAK